MLANTVENAERHPEFTRAVRLAAQICERLRNECNAVAGRGSVASKELRRVASNQTLTALRLENEILGLIGEEAMVVALGKLEDRISETRLGRSRS